MNRTQAIDLVNKIYDLQLQRARLVDKLVTEMPADNDRFAPTAPPKAAREVPLIDHEKIMKGLGITVRGTARVKRPHKRLAPAAMQLVRERVAAMLSHNSDRAYTSGEMRKVCGPPKASVDAYRNILDDLRRRGLADEAKPKKRGRWTRYTASPKLAGKRGAVNHVVQRALDKDWLPSKGSQIERIWFHFNDHPGIIYTPAELARELGVNESSMRGSLIALSGRGLINKVGAGNYVSAPDPTAPVAKATN